MKITHDFDCRSILINREADFHQLSIVIEGIRENLNVYRAENESIMVSLFEVPPELVIPLQNLDDLSAVLFKETQPWINDKQQRYLLVCKRTVAAFYCYIQQFIKTLADDYQKDSIADTNKQIRKFAFDFYHDVSYELRTPYYNLKLFTQNQILESDTKEVKEFIGQINSSPFIPENQDTVEKINYWTGELEKFMDDVPRLMREFSNEESG